MTDREKMLEEENRHLREKLQSATRIIDDLNEKLRAMTAREQANTGLEFIRLEESVKEEG